MAHAEIHSTASAARIASVIATPFKAVWNFLLEVGELSSRGQQIRQLSELTDEELAERGVTREDVVRRIFGGCI